MLTEYCIACGTTSDLQKHHLVPQSLGGSNAQDNLITLCKVCHGKVHDIDYTNPNNNKRKKSKMKTAYDKGSNAYNIRLHNKRLAYEHRLQEFLRPLLEANPGLTYREIADYLNLQKMKNFAGNPFTAQNIYREFKRWGWLKADERHNNYPGKRFRRRQIKNPCENL